MRKGLVFTLGGVILTAGSGLAGLFFLMMMINMVGENAEPTECSSECDLVDDLAIEAYTKAAEDALDEDGCDIDWTILAGIGQVESRHGSIFGGTIGPDGVVDPPILGPELDGSGVGGNTTPMPSGAWEGQYGLGKWTQAVGPMQFLPSTWDIYGDGGNPHSIFDAARAAARLLCDAGIEEDVKGAIWAYNHSNDYVAKVLYWAAIYGRYGGEETHVDAELLDNPRVCLSEFAKEDLRDGIVDPRLVVFMQHMAERWDFCVSILRTGHATCVINTGIYPDCRVSNHWYGRAVDISAVGRELVTPDNEFARDVVRWIEQGQGQVWMPDSVGSPWAAEFGFTDALHQDHLHIAFYSDGTMQDVGIDGGEIEDRPDRVDNTSYDLTVFFPGVDWYEAAEAAEFEDVWTQPLPPQIAAPGVQVGDKWHPDWEDTAPEYEHPDDWRRPTHDRPPDAGWGEEPDHDADGGLLDLQAMIDATGDGQQLRVPAGRYSAAIISRPITIVGPLIGEAVIAGDPDGSRSVLAIAHTTAVSIEGLRLEGGTWGIHSTFSDVTLRNLVVVDASSAGIEIRGGSVDVAQVEVTRTSTGIGLWSTSAVLDQVRVSEIGVDAILAVDSVVSVRRSTMTSSGGGGVNVRGVSEVIIEKSFIGGAAQGCVRADGPSSMWVHRSALWSCSGAAVSKMGDAVVAQWANAIVDGQVTVTWSASGVVGEEARSTLGAPWINTNGDPTPDAMGSLDQVPDTRSDDDRRDWPQPAAELQEISSV